MFSCPIGCPSDCCKFETIEEAPVVLEDEIPILTKEAEKIGVKLTFREYGFYNGVKLYKWVIEGWCPFYKGRCTIHEKKPLACRMYPLVLNLKTGEIYLSDKCLWVKINGPKPLDHFPAEKEALRRLVVKLKIK
ncbi:YkgJ family cysteine cluster protein [Pyrobaculum sp. 3827-6]|uniref:YkgJ family cysteine cluster protein n=1 Tax=Pyrobaculum sp. 3827-6 TaxID=2983604 RepID=UPI0021D9ECE1|nr:YkgJ family cysteine cluster protein [Pyrobaculum sp. 3827-6]MCU7788061.1 YkgJ family cysteine cluster protein [Pyrobaculum sp. 3827-6]